MFIPDELLELENLQPGHVFIMILGLLLVYFGKSEFQTFGWVLVGVGIATVVLRQKSQPGTYASEAQDFDEEAAQAILQALPWRCFHCDFVTNDEEDAVAHFGERDDAEEFTPICKWWAHMDADERADTLQDTLKELNGERDHSHTLRVENEQLEFLVGKYSSEYLIELKSYKPFEKATSIRDVFNIYDSMEGRALAAEERLQNLEVK